MSNKTVVYDEERKQFSLEDSGGGSGGSTLETHRILVFNNAPRIITAQKGILVIVKDVEQINNFTLQWSTLTEKVQKLTLKFELDCNDVRNVGINGAILNRLPTSVKVGDVWEVVYDDFYRTWTLMSSNSVGTDRQIMGFVDGIQQPITLGIIQLTDIAGFPAFANGVFTATAMNAETQTGILSFVEFSTTTAKAGTFPTYGTGGVLVVGTATANNHAVTKAQLDAKPSIGTTATTAKRGDYTPTATEIVTAINAMTPEQVTVVQIKLGITPTP